MSDESDLAALLIRIRACRQCRDAPDSEPRAQKPLAHEPRPVVRASATARILIAGQAPGARVHASGAPFTDPSGDRLRDWLGVTSEEFYDESRISIVPMGFCYPGTDARGADYPPRPECRRLWHDVIFQALPPPRLILCIGQYAIDYHFQRLGLDQFRKASMTQIVAEWRAILAAAPVPLLVLPHPSWRNNGWIRKNPLFEQEILPYLRQKVRAILNN